MLAERGRRTYRDASPRILQLRERGWETQRGPPIRLAKCENSLSAQGISLRLEINQNHVAGELLPCLLGSLLGFLFGCLLRLLLLLSPGTALHDDLANAGGNLRGTRGTLRRERETRRP